MRTRTHARRAVRLSTGASGEAWRRTRARWATRAGNTRAYITYAPPYPPAWRDDARVPAASALSAPPIPRFAQTGRLTGASRTPAHEVHTYMGDHPRSTSSLTLNLLSSQHRRYLPRIDNSRRTAALPRAPKRGRCRRAVRRHRRARTPLTTEAYAWPICTWSSLVHAR